VAPDKNPETRTVSIRDASIRLGQLLKLADIIDHGSEARELLIQGDVRVNGEVETRRGRQLVPGDTVTVRGQTVGIESLGH
jgi:ribosome-associated protein